MSLRCDWCSYNAALYAAQHWHYSKCLPAGKLVRVGVWEDDRYIGVVIFSYGACNSIGNPYGLVQTQVCELTRVALAPHKAFVSEIVAKAIKMLKRHSPGLRLIVSFSDTNQKHHGGIYQAGNWIYVGHTASEPSVKYKGRVYHKRSFNSLCHARGFTAASVKDKVNVPQPYKHKYLYPLDRKMRKQIEPLRKPYPKRMNGSSD